MVDLQRREVQNPRGAWLRPNSLAEGRPQVMQLTGFILGQEARRTAQVVNSGPLLRWKDYLAEMADVRGPRRRRTQVLLREILCFER